MTPKFYTTDPITLRGENAALREQNAAALDTIAKLTAELRTANARAVTLAADLSQATQTADELRYQLRLANRRDAAGDVIGGGRVGDWERLARTLVDSAPCWMVDEIGGWG